MRKLSFRCLSALLAVLMLLSTASTVVFATPLATAPIANDDAYTNIIVSEDFEEGYTEGQALVNGNDFWVGDIEVNVTKDREAEIGKDTYRDGLNASYTGKAAYLGIPAAKLNHASKDPQSDQYTKKFKLEFREKRYSASGFFYVNDKLLVKHEGNDLKCLDKGVSEAVKIDDSTNFYGGVWQLITIYFDFENDSYDIYVNDRYKDTLSLGGAIKSLDSVKLTAGTVNTAGTLYIDDITVAAYAGGFENTNSTIKNGATDVSLDPVFTVNFSENLGTVTKSMVSVEGGTTDTEYNVSANGNALTVDFVDGLEEETEYTVILKRNIPSESGAVLGADVAKKFTTNTLESAKYAEKIAYADFENIAAGGIIGSSAADNTTTTFEIDGTSYYVPATIPANIINTATGNATNVAMIKKTTANARLGFASTHFANNQINGEYPKKVKVSFDVMRTTLSHTAYLYMGKTTGSGAIEAIMWGSGSGSYNGAFTFTTAEGTRKAQYGDKTKYPVNDWNKVEMYFDFTEGVRRYDVYIDGEVAAEDLTINSSIGYITSLYFDSAYTLYIDNFEVSAVETFNFKTSSIADGATGVSPQAKSLTVTFDKNIGALPEDAVTLTGEEGATVPSYTVTKNGKNLTVNFDGDFTLGKTYTLTLSEDLQSRHNTKLGTDTEIEFTISSVYAPTGFNYEIFDIKFSDEYKTAGAVVNGSKYYNATAGLAVMTEDPERGLVAAVGRGSNKGIGLTYGTINKLDPVRKNFGSLSGATIKQKFAKLVKFSIDFKRESYLRSGEIRFFTGTGYSTELVKLGISGDTAPDGQYMFKQGNSFNTGCGPARETSNDQLTWHTMDIYFDFNLGKYYPYVDGVSLGVYTLPTNLVNEGGIDGVNFMGYNSDGNKANLFVDKFSLYTIDSYGSPIISELIHPEAKKMAFTYVNTAETEKAMKLIKAKYDAEGALVGTTVEPITAPASDGYYLNVPYPAAETGFTYKYFIWEGLDTMKPVTAVKELN